MSKIKMQKGLSVFMVLFFIFQMIVPAVYADGSTPVSELWIGETKVVSAGVVYTTSGPGWSYDSDNSTLTFNGLNITNVAPSDQINYEDYAYSLYRYGLYCKGDLNIVNNGNNVIDIRAVTSTKHIGMYIFGNLSVYGSGELVSKGTWRGLFVDGNLVTSDVVAFSGIAESTSEATINGIVVNQSITVSDTSSLIGTAIGGRSDTYGIQSIIGNITVDRGATLIGRLDDEGARYNNSRNSGVSAGRELSSGGRVSVEGTLVARSGSTSENGNVAGLYLVNVDLFVSGSGSVLAESGELGSTSSTSNGVAARGSSTIQVNGGGFLASGASNAVDPSSTLVTINGTPVYYEVSTNRDGSDAVSYTSPEAWAAVNGNFGGYKYIRATTIYEVYVNGIQVTRVNRHDVLGDGRVSYLPASDGNPAQLRLNGANFAGDIDLSEETEIILEGENILRDINTPGNLTISGGGELTVTREIDCSNTNLTIAENSKLSVEGTVTALSLTQQGELVNNGEVIVTSNFSGDGAIVNNGKVVLPSGTSNEAAERIAGDGLNELKGADESSSIYYSNGIQLALVRDTLDLSGATDLTESGYQWEEESKTLTLGNILIKVSEGKGIILPEDATLILGGNSFVITGNTGIEGDTTLSIEGNRFLKVTSTTSSGIMVVNGTENSGVILGEELRIVKPTEGISALDGAREVIITRKLEQEPLNIEDISSKTYGDEGFTLSILGGSGTGEVVYSSSNPEVISISGSVATIHKAGEIEITATKASDDLYLEKVSSPVAVTVAKKILNVEADNKQNIRMGSEMPEFTFTVSGLVGSDTFTEPMISSTVDHTRIPGEYVISISEGTLSNAENYEVIYTNGRLSIVNPNTNNDDDSGSDNSSGPTANTPPAEVSNNNSPVDILQIQESVGNTISIIAAIQYTGINTEQPGQPMTITFSMDSVTEDYIQNNNVMAALIGDNGIEEYFPVTLIDGVVVANGITVNGVYALVEAPDLNIIRMSVDQLNATINNSNLPIDASPIISNNRTLVPLRFIGGSLGANVEWDGANQTVRMELDGIEIELVIGRLGEGLDVPAQIINNRTMVPVRYISERLGAKVSWNETTKTIQIVKERIK